MNSKSIHILLLILFFTFCNYGSADEKTSDSTVSEEKIIIYNERGEKIGEAAYISKDYLLSFKLPNNDMMERAE